MYEDYTALKIARREKILTITIDNPPMNSIHRFLHGELARVFKDASRDPDTAVVVLTGAGEKAFSAGGDLPAMAERIEKQLHHRWTRTVWEAKEIITDILNLEKPLISRINGHAMGLGATLAVFADFSYIVDSATIADTHVKVGLAAGDGGALIWPLLMGFANARRYLMTGETMTGRQAAELGLVTGSCPDLAALDAKVSALAEQLQAGAPLAINATKNCINALLRKLLVDLIPEHLGLETHTYLSADHYEAVTAFLQKRPPQFKGA